MKNFIAGLIEVIIVGGLTVVLLLILGIETTALQAGIITGGVMLIVGIASGIKNLITNGGLYRYEWAIQYNEHSINIIANNAEELYINGSLADRKTGVSRKAVELKGLLDSGEKITAVLSPANIAEANKNGRALRCELFVDGKALQMATTTQ